jgi:predicted GNAT family acetyltransferase
MEPITFLSKPGRFYFEKDNQLLAVIDYHTDEKNRIVVTHTFVDPSLRGQGIANQLLNQVIALAEAGKQYIYPICSFAVKVLQNERYQHLWDPDEGRPDGGACTWLR